MRGNVGLRLLRGISEEEGLVPTRTEYWNVPVEREIGWKPILCDAIRRDTF